MNCFAAVSLHLQASSVAMFNGVNFSEWCEQVKFHLGVSDLDLALLEEKSAAITDESSEEDKSHHKAWERSNRLSLMFMRMTIANNIKTTIPQTENAKEYLKFVEELFRTADKSLAGSLMAELTTMKFDGSRSMQEHIIEMTNIAARLRSLGMTMEDSFIVQFILNSLPPEYGPFQINYNTIKDKWDINELASKLVQEEVRLKKHVSHSVNLVGQGAGKALKPKANKFKKGKTHVNAPNVERKDQKASKCHFCRKDGHFQKDCLKRKAWFEKKGKPSALGFLTIQTINPNESFLSMGNRMKASIEGIRTYRLVLDTGYHLDLLRTLYVPSVARNLISLSRLDVFGFNVTFGHGCFNLFKDSSCIGSGTLSDGLYKLKLDDVFAESLLVVHRNVGIKQAISPNTCIIKQSMDSSTKTNSRDLNPQRHERDKFIVHDIESMASEILEINLEVQGVAAIVS
ncbi:Retrovirus-related Pol polyprotein from transposon TNT 1-94 [Senna tora]|uniref:Retrovirus-related Pol polyprotein from transposon TNT 1-94 n=1 Tax=Senna tora TaxID=362788 RepID=A0A834SPK7_9FABA|nr:Retrovirus-related Pol polyprotein from transposon TNT 1-94 [Senna tora]